jgi:hypothetical protein
MVKGVQTLAVMWLSVHSYPSPGAPQSGVVRDAARTPLPAWLDAMLGSSSLTHDEYRTEEARWHVCRTLNGGPMLTPSGAISSHGALGVARRFFAFLLNFASMRFSSRSRKHKRAQCEDAKLVQKVPAAMLLWLSASLRRTEIVDDAWLQPAPAVPCWREISTGGAA